MAQNREFLSAENFKNLVSICKRFVLDKHNIDIEATSIDLPKTMFETMQKVCNDPDTANITTRDMNKLTIKSVTSMVLKTMNGPNGSLFSSTSRDSSLTRDTALYGKRNVNSTHLLPEMAASRNGLMDNYEQTKQSRAPPATPTMQDPGLVAYEEKPLLESEFQQRMQALQQQRDTQEPSTGNSPANSMLQRNTLVASTMEMPRLEPKEIYQPMLPIVEEVAVAKNESDGAGTPSFETMIIPRDMMKPPHDYKIVQKYVLVNSLDRDWLQQQMRYKYKVKFTYTSQSIVTRPIYENNPTIPNTATYTTPGIQNVAGWFDESGRQYPKYDPNSTAPQVQVGTEVIPIPVDNDANIQSNFKNIHSIQITKVIIPMDIPVTVQNTSGVTGGGAATNKIIFNNDYGFNFPYVLLQIQEFSDMYEGTDDTIRKSFCKLVFDKTYQSDVGRGYIVLKPAQEEKKVFCPTALSVMPSLSISLLRPTGNLINNSVDGISLLRVDYELQMNAFYLKIWTNNYFDQNDFYTGDLVIIRDFTIYRVSPDQTAQGVSMMNAYINRPEGHEIVMSGDANTKGFYNSFYIRAPSKFDDVHGNLIVDPSVHELQHFNAALSTASVIQNGFILNASLQNSISFKIEQKVYDSSIIGSLNV